jgi:hypothetical protein
MVGDTRWDIEVARQAAIDTVCVITGGWSDQELRDAGRSPCSNPSRSCAIGSTRLHWALRHSPAGRRHGYS